MELLTLRLWMGWLRGRQRAVWLPSFQDDLTIIDITPVGSPTLHVAWCGYTRFGQALTGRRDMWVQFVDGTAMICRAVGATELDSLREDIALESAPGVVLSPATVARISWLTLCRADSDDVALHHITDSEGVTETELIFRGVRDDDF
ncbi:hypothetical protein FACS189441_7070 [Betaproteobacteria bacterium]|nr:hypothetical protein FACS189441_7070 [Betaproteobacteria bacterium]